MAATDLTTARTQGDGPRLLFIEPYLNASHRALVQGLMDHVPARWQLLGLAGGSFRWRMRGAAAYLAHAAADLLAQPWDGLVCSSMLNLTELRGLVPALALVPALLYFHENQLAYPAGGAADRAQQERDLYLAFSNLTSAAVAKAVLFNSAYHRDEVLAAARELLPRLPDARPLWLSDELERKSRVLPVPIDTSEARGLNRDQRSGPLRILWNHRWAQDKAPEDFFAALGELDRAGANYELAVLGLSGGRPPKVFVQAREALAPRVAQWGGVADRREYWRWLMWADVVVSTARQEYQGLSVAEAVWAGCRPVLPDALVYPELYEQECLYPMGGLAEALTELCARPDQARAKGWGNLARGMTWEALGPAWTREIYGLLTHQ